MGPLKCTRKPIIQWWLKLCWPIYIYHNRSKYAQKQKHLRNTMTKKNTKKTSAFHSLVSYQYCQNLVGFKGQDRQWKSLKVLEEVWLFGSKSWRNGTQLKTFVDHKICPIRDQFLFNANCMYNSWLNVSHVFYWLNVCIDFCTTHWSVYYNGIQVTWIWISSESSTALPSRCPASGATAFTTTFRPVRPLLRPTTFIAKLCSAESWTEAWKGRGED